jgi:hypothetical protein
MSTLAKRVKVSPDARLKVYYDVREIVDGTTSLNFFQPNPNKDVTRNNYISNPFPGEDDRMVIGLSFELVKQAIVMDAGNNIDPELIVNAVKDAGVRLTADNDYKEFLRAPLSNHFNFLGTDLDIAIATAGDPASGSETTIQDKVVTMKNTSLQKVPDPFIIAANQSMDLEVTFANGSAFPSAAEWTASGQGKLYMKAKLYVAEVR